MTIMGLKAFVVLFYNLEWNLKDEFKYIKDTLKFNVYIKTVVL